MFRYWFQYLESVGGVGLGFSDTKDTILKRNVTQRPIFSSETWIFHPKATNLSEFEKKIS